MSIVRPPFRRSSGITLVMVLLGLALMMILLLALFAGTLNQSHGAANDALLGREKMLADSAVALVIGQIQQASTQPGQAWISQPGLLRTYAADTTRKPTACYKLYSTASLAAMKDQTGTLAFMASDVPSDWSSRPAEYTDLNSPVQTIYPILDQAAVGAVPGVGSDTGQVEMPVAWLYQLQDGTLGPASNGTAANPIVARIAFWTDDETSKININTAGCGSPWNTPRTNSPDDVTWSNMQPAAGEFSAYPGHPATTSLGGVFSALTPQQLLGLTPRYAWGGSQFGAQPTTPGESVPLKMDRLYASIDELCFSSSLTSSGQRVPNPVGADSAGILQFQNLLKTARFVLTAHSEAPETTLLGEPRVAIWPVADSTSAAAPRITATDSAIMTAATVGTGTTSVRTYYYQRNDPLNALDDFDPKNTAISPATASNLQLFNDLVARGKVIQPGYSAAFDSTDPAAKYPDANWNQLMLEIIDFIRGLNAVDPNSAIIPFAKSDPTTGIGRGFIVPLTMQYGPVANPLTLRGLGRCPTLSSLTLVLYVSGFEFNNNPNDIIDFDEVSDDAVAKKLWDDNLDPKAPSQRWAQVTHELVRAFFVPCTFQPGCAYPEMSDACSIQITGLDGIKVTSGGKSSNFGFTSPAVPLPIAPPTLGTPLTKIPADRSWGGNEGPIIWRQAADALAKGGVLYYPFAGSKAFPLPLGQGMPLPSAWARSLLFNDVKVTVSILGFGEATLQTLTLDFPLFGIHAPTINGECDHADPPPSSSNSETDWATNPNCFVEPWWYMSLKHRLQTSQNSRSLLIQAGDISRSVEANTDLRVISGLPKVPYVPNGLFHPHPGYSLTQLNHQNGSHAHNLRFADGTSVCFALGPVVADGNQPSYTLADTITPAYATKYALTNPIVTAYYPTMPETLVTVTDWDDGATQAYYNIFDGPPCSVPTGSNGVWMLPAGQSVTATSLPGDWDTGPGFAPDGALINLPDSGTDLDPLDAYRSLTTGKPGAPTQRTPNALVPSPVIFGSLPAGINPNDSVLAANGTPQSQQWRTLLFCPYPAANTLGANSLATPYYVHPGAANPPDHLILDNFWMPVVEPYAISTCMATAGKINLNYQIAPFTYLHRDTALRALLDSLRIPAIPIGDAGSPSNPVSYKSNAAGSAIPSIWNAVDEPATLAQIESRFTGGSADAYLSESEICTVPLVPSEKPPSPFSAFDVAGTRTALSAFWNGNPPPKGPPTPDGILTGDNLRELPYAQLYGRLTTRSNSYTVHVRVQVLKKLTHDPDQNVWKEGTDVVLGDWRGSYEIERYLDPTAPAPNAGSPLGGPTTAAPLGYYKFRIVSARAFSP